MEPISRRKFIVQTGATLSLLQLRSLTFGAVGGEDGNDKDDHITQHYVDHSGVHLYFHLINTREHNGHLIPASVHPSYLIVQLPPQSLHEQYFHTKSDGDRDTVPEAQLQAMLSGPSFLVFKLWPKLEGRRKRLLFEVEALLDWEDQELFRLQTAEDIDRNAWTTIETKCKYKAAQWNPEDLRNKGRHDLKYYLTLRDKLFQKQESQHKHLHLTVFELPAGILTAPISQHGTRDDSAADSTTEDLKWTPIVRQNRARKTGNCIYERCYRIDRKGRAFIRHVRERWNAELEFQAPKTAPNELHLKEPLPIASLPPSLRVIGLLGSDDIEGLKHEDCTSVPRGCPPCHEEPPESEAPIPIGYLPTLLDAAELLYLTQLGKKNYRGPDFDLKGKGPFMLTSLGATLKFHYKNVNTLLIKDPSVSLVEYEHHFQDGRDNYIRVARIGVVSPLGTKALHVRIAQRKIDQGRSFLEYKEYIEFIERERSYASEKEVGTGNTIQGAREYCHYTADGQKPDCDFRPNTRAWPFSRVEILVPRTPNMEPVPESERSAFWVYRERRSGEAPRRTFEDLIKVPVQYYDQNGKPIGAASNVPLLFLARNFFCSTTVDNWFLGNHATSLQNNDDARLRVHTSGQVVALTPDDPDPLPNKVNQLATDWCEYQIAVAKPLTEPDASKSCSVFDVAEHVIYPQMRRAKVYLDHVQQYGGVKLPSVVEYESAYLQHGLTDDATAFGGGNEARVILKHTDDFIKGKLEDLKGQLLSDVGHPSNRWEADLDKAWEQIDRAFSAAGDRLGGMINPSPLLERISTSKAALSLADGVDTLSNLDPQKMFGKLDAELFCGIRLKDILGILDMESAPQYLLNKIPDDLRDPQRALAETGGNAVLQRVIAKVNSTADEVARLKAVLEKARTDLVAAKGRYEALERLLRDQLPDYRKLLSAARLRFDAARSAYRQDITKVERLILAALETIKAMREFGLEGMKPMVADFLNVQIRNILGDARFIPIWTKLDVKGDLDQLRRDLVTLWNWAQRVQVILTNPSTSEEAKTKLLAALLTEPGVQDTLAAQGLANKFYERTQALTKLYELVRERLEEEEREIWDTGLRQIELLRRTANGFYEAERERMEKEVSDIMRSAKVEIKDGIGILNELYEPGRVYTNELLNIWGTTDAKVKAALEFIRNPRNIEKYAKAELDAFEAAFIAAAKDSPLYKDLADNLEDYKKRGRELLVAKNKLEKAGRELIEHAQEEAMGVLAKLDGGFNKEIARLSSMEEVKEAREAYAKFRQLLQAVKRQELVLDWHTEEFKQADLGFITFEPSKDPKTRLAMKVRGVMEMAPLRFPSVVQRTEVSTETRLSDFGLTFMKVIGIRFGHIELVSGTGRATDLNVKIDDVTFAGGLSFIQLLQGLLSGLVDGMRMEIGSSHVAVGFQTPAISISSPGFTFSNLSVAMLLMIHFDRRPMRLRFDLARADQKATIAAGIYGGCFYCSLTLEPKRGIVAIEMALEMGAFTGISFGPFRGYVKFMVGLFYKKDDHGVVLEGYLIAEGVLSVWVVSVSARLYMGVRSVNSYVEGFCVASYSFKIGFVRKQFSATYTKRVSGAASSAPNGTSSPAALAGGKSTETVIEVLKGELLNNRSSGGIKLLFVDEHQPMSDKEFQLFARRFFPATN